jgi:hypothetical protein
MTQPKLPTAVCGFHLKIAAVNRRSISCQHIDILLQSLDVVYVALV